MSMGDSGFGELWRRKRLIDALTPDPQLQEDISKDVTESQSPLAQAQRSVETTGQAVQDYPQQAPQYGDYHPSGKRKIAGILAGILGGPQLSEDIIYRPLERQRADYQRGLEQKQEAYKQALAGLTAESGASEREAQRKAEVERAGAEEARRKSEEWKIGPEGQQFELNKLKIQHPSERKGWSPPQIMETKEGKIPVIINQDTGEARRITLPDTDITGASKPGVEREPKKRAGVVGLIDDAVAKFTQENKREPTLEESMKIEQDIMTHYQPDWKKGVEETKAGAAETRANRPPATGTYSVRERDAKVKQYTTSILKDIGNVRTHADNTKAAISALQNKTAVADAVAIPMALKALVAGQGSGFRMTQSEINQVMGGMTQWEKFSQIVNQWSTDPQHAKFPPEFRDQLIKVLDAQGKWAAKNLKHGLDSFNAINSAEDTPGVDKAMSGYLSGPSETPDLPGGITLDEINAEIERRKKK